MNTEQINIMFVCMGNICRSPLAHGIFKAMVKAAGLQNKINIESSGTISYHSGELPDARMRKEASKHGITLDHRARQIRPDDINTYDLILAMDNSNLQNIMQLTGYNPSDSPHVKLFRSYDPEGGIEVPDPYYGGIDGFRDVYAIVERTCSNLLSEIIREYSLDSKKESVE